MDADNFIWIFIVVGITIFGFIKRLTAKTEEMAEQEEARRRAAMDFQENMRQQAMKVRAVTPQQKPRPAKRNPLPSVPVKLVHELPVEGERVVTKTSPPVEAQPKTVNTENTENPLRDKNNLVRALIYGDVLKRRF